MTDPQLPQEVAIAVGRHLWANPPGDSSVDDVETAFAAAIMRTADELVIPPRSEEDQGKVGVETPKQKLSCRLRLMQCTQPGSS